MNRHALIACSFALLLVLPSAANAANGGSWDKQSAGGIVSMGQQLLVGHTLRSPQKIPRGAMLKQIAWKITLLSPPPTGLEIKLCNQHQCLSLPSLTGHLMLKHAMSPSGDFRFIYFVNRQGQLRPPLNVVSNQLTISYR